MWIVLFFFIVLIATPIQTFSLLYNSITQFHIWMSPYLHACSSYGFYLSQVQYLHVEQEAMETSTQQDLERKLAGLRNEVQVQIIYYCCVMLLCCAL